MLLFLIACSADKTYPPEEEAGVECGEFFHIFTDENTEFNSTATFITSTDPTLVEDGYTGTLTPESGVDLSGEVYLVVNAEDEYGPAGVQVSGDGNFLGHNPDGYSFQENVESYWCNSGLHVGAWGWFTEADEYILVGQFRLAEEDEPWHYDGSTTGATVQQQVLEFSLYQGTYSAEVSTDELEDMSELLATGTFNRRW